MSLHGESGTILVTEPELEPEPKPNPDIFTGLPSDLAFKFMAFTISLDSSIGGP